MPKIIAINGAFAGRPITGIERFAIETVRALDACVEPGRFRLVVPRRADLSAMPPLTNIEVVRFGSSRGTVWKQLCFAWYSLRHGLETLNLCNTGPLLAPGVICIHDVFYRSRAADFRGSLRGWLSVCWHRLHYRWSAWFAHRILTVSNHSAEEITRWYKVPRKRITVAGTGWEHLTRIVADDGIFTRFPELASGGYLLALGSRAPNKNLRWIERAAERNPALTFVLAGGAVASAVQEKIVVSSNLKRLGRISDGEVKALLRRCRALVFPSLEEGFGIPPLEALAEGRPAVVADRPPMREIYGEAVHYLPASVDLGDGEGLTESLASRVTSPEAVLKRHTWANVARVVLSAVDAL